MPNSQGRPDPDRLLAAIQAEEQQVARGRLLVFLGYAAGVGKTYAMLQAAQLRKLEGIDVVVGYVETHGRAETDALLAGLEVIPRRTVVYRDTTLSEMDLDGVLARRPRLALVDEFAHSNAPGSRHPKRHQDVEELLAAGVDVYTTLNVQHLESLNDIVAQITGVVVRETVPDSVIDQATEIRLVDLPPAELVQRLQEGKVYVPAQAQRAIEKFFRLGNLTALREISLRRAAERVDDQMRVYMDARAIPGPWPAAERLLVCVSPSPLSERLIRSARRLADELNAEWFALYVETASFGRLGDAQRDQLARNLQLADDLGGKSSTLPGQSVVDTCLQFARSHNITKIIAGKPLRPRWQELIHGSVVDQLIRESGPIDVYVVSSSEDQPAISAPPWTSASAERRRPWRHYLYSALLVAVATLLGHPLRPVLSPTNLVMLYLAAVVVAAVYLGRGPAIFTSILGVVAFDLFFVPPIGTFVVSDTQYVLTFIGLLVVGVIITALTTQAKDQADAATRRESETAALYDLSRDLAAALTQTDILQTVIQHVAHSFGRDVVIFLPQDAVPPAGAAAPANGALQATNSRRPVTSASGRLQVAAASSDLNLRLDGWFEEELAVAEWVYQHGEPAGRNTDTLPAASLRYMPLKTARSTLGVLGVVGPDGMSAKSGATSHAMYSSPLSPEQRRLMDAFASQAALALERTNLAEQARQAEVLQVTERLQTALLNSVSHELRTPLVSITGALSTLLADAGVLDQAMQNSLVENALEEAQRLNRLVGNLLDMTRLEAGALPIRLEPSDVQDVIGATLEQIGTRLEGREVRVNVPPGLPLMPLDFVPIVQVLVNLLDNALRYSPVDRPIDVNVRATNQHFEIEVADRGPGISPDDLEHIFDRFYLLHRPAGSGGTGLGLSICKGIVEAHGGTISARNRADGGASFVLTLPQGAESDGRNVVRFANTESE